LEISGDVGRLGGECCVGYACCGIDFGYHLTATHGYRPSTSARVAYALWHGRSVIFAGDRRWGLDGIQVYVQEPLL
jgi:hypothetical protein